MKRRIAVSILVTRDPKSTEVYLVERNPKLAFFGGFLAFPGGTLDPEDRDIEVRHTPEEKLKKDPDFSTFLASAARELFEETGIWVARGKAPPKERLVEYRRRLIGEEADFGELLRAEGQHIDGRDFVPICRIVTPPFTPVRYDTWFFLYQLKKGEEPEIWPGELQTGQFRRATDALSGWLAGKLLLVPPIVLILRELKNRSIASFLPHVDALAQSYLRGKLHRVYFSCGVLLAPLKTHTRPPATHTNAYVVGHRRLYLVDPGSSNLSEQERLWELLDELVAEGAQLEGILLTHWHPDHTGAVEACQQRYQIPLLGHPKTASALSHLAFDRLLEEVDRLDLGAAPDGSPNWGLEIYHLPGHAPDHLAFRETRYGAILVGDLVSTLSSILIDPSEGDLTTYMSSLERLEELTTGTLYPGHGPAMRDGRRIVRKAIQHRKQREQQILQALEMGAESTQELLEQVYSDVPRSMLSLAGRSLQSGLVKLEREGRVETAGNHYRLIR